MENLIINATAKTPNVKLDAIAGSLEIIGNSMADNPTKFYKPVVDWMNGYIQNPADETKMVVMLKSFNTNSSKCLLDVFKCLEKLFRNGKNVTINWMYEENDEDMLDAGKGFEALIRCPIKFIQVIDY